ncbi:MAG: asparagine synthase (glutamine-hydrolyzing) [Acetivibrionales bacterium]|jgi:asparagine synthase (glutamine-hydrolysing)
MCGIAGFASTRCDMAALNKMGDMLSHRGPDETGFFYEHNVGLINKRLSIIDLENGKQPAFNENHDIAVVLNGEIFNHLELRKRLEAGGHVISNNSDTAVLPHLYEEYGQAMFEKLNGQFAIAIYDKKLNKLLLARDRLGIAPLFYYFSNREFIFASEVKAILASGRVPRVLCYEAFYDVFAYWSPQHDRTMFEGVKSVLPGQYLIVENGEIRVGKYYRLMFRKPDERLDFDTAREEIEALLIKAVEKRLMGDVKISSYLSGGLDSSLITAIVAKHFNSSVEAFSVNFEDERFDEEAYQKQVCDMLGIKRHSILFKSSDFPELMNQIIWHTEAPLLRGGPVPLFKLSQLVCANNIKVVLSGEGSDEFFGGYDIFKEAKIREYIKRYPESESRMKLLKRVNRFSNSRFESAKPGGLGYFYLHNHLDGLFESHHIRWRQIGFFERFFSDNARMILKREKNLNYAASLGFDCPEQMKVWSHIQRSQYLEVETFLTRYLLSIQGDRMSMANSVEVRFPFLDHELIGYCMALNDRFKIKALNEKYILKKIALKYLPQDLVNRRKFPYRSPVDVRKILKDPYMRYMLSDEKISRFNLFNVAKVKGFINGIMKKDILSEREIMLFMGILTTQILCVLFNIETQFETVMPGGSSCV